MASFTRVYPQYYGATRSSNYLVDGQLTLEDVSKINSISNDTILIFHNTRGQSSEIIKQITNPNITISVMGGLDYLSKKKYQDEDYVERTFLTPSELSSVIEYFREIESKIKYSWTETQKVLYIYKTLVEKLHYKYDGEKSYENGRDVVRSLPGLLYGKLVCSGFALVFKEALDRIGVENYYQNRASHHSWNVVKLDGQYRGLELTWDCFNKGKDNTCNFTYFGREKDFYKNHHHDISTEPEEHQYDLVTFSDDELVDNVGQVLNFGNTRTEPMKPIIDSTGNTIYYLEVGKTGATNSYAVYLNGKLYYIYSDLPAEECLSFTNIRVAVLNNNCIDPATNIKPHGLKMFRRNDGTDFWIKKTKELEGMNEHYYYEVTEKEGRPSFRRGVVLSEMDLTISSDPATESFIANNLISSERLRRKINHYNGYVGYVSGNGGLRYNRTFETEKLNITVRK